LTASVLSSVIGSALHAEKQNTTTAAGATKEMDRCFMSTTSLFPMRYERVQRLAALMIVIGGTPIKRFDESCSQP
jgi:hypothetical protein